MKSQSRKKRLDKEAKNLESVQGQRNTDSDLMNLFSAFLPSYRYRRPSKYVDDGWGNRILRPEVREDHTVPPCAVPQDPDEGESE